MKSELDLGILMEADGDLAETDLPRKAGGRASNHDGFSHEHQSEFNREWLHVIEHLENVDKTTVGLTTAAVARDFLLEPWG